MPRVRRTTLTLPLYWLGDLQRLGSELDSLSIFTGGIGAWLREQRSSKGVVLMTFVTLGLDIYTHPTPTHIV